jgi:hypothetical protein
MQAEAVLPPPFPSLAPHRFYISNMAVVPSARRRGAARRLLAAAVTTGRRWGEDSAWLHVGATNEGAARLYAAHGFEPPARPDAKTRLSNLVPGPWSQRLMTRPLPDAGGWLRRWAAAQEAAGAAEAAGAGGSTAKGGRASEEGAGGADGGGDGGGGGGGGAFQWQRVVAEEQRQGAAP